MKKPRTKCHLNKHNVKRRKYLSMYDGIYQICRDCGELIQKSVSRVVGKGNWVEK